MKPNTTSVKLSSVVVLGKSQESVDSLFASREFAEFLNEYQQMIHVVHLTDQHLYNNFDMMLRVKFTAHGKASLDKQPLLI